MRFKPLKLSSTLSIQKVLKNNRYQCNQEISLWEKNVLDERGVLGKRLSCLFLLYTWSPEWPHSFIQTELLAQGTHFSHLHPMKLLPCPNNPCSSFKYFFCKCLSLNLRLDALGTAPIVIYVGFSHAVLSCNFFFWLDFKILEDCDFFFPYWGLNSGPTLSVTPPVLFDEGCFGDRVSRTICPGWPQTAILLISASWVARIICVNFVLIPWRWAWHKV
jgi:hypothetical protein